jgi:hypothetical protein
MIESDWSLHSSESDGNETLGTSKNKLAAPSVGKKRRSELDNLKENLTDLMKAPILPIKDSDDEAGDKEKRKKKRERKEKDKEKEEGASKDAPDTGSKESESPHASRDKDPVQHTRVAQLPTPSTTHSNNSTEGGTPRQQSLGDNEDEPEGTSNRVQSTDFAMITPPPSNKTQSADEAEQPNRSHPTPGRELRDEKGRRFKYEYQYPKNWGARKSIPPIRVKIMLSGSDEESTKDTKDSDSEDQSSSTSDQEEQKRVYAFRQRKLKETQASTNRKRGGANNASNTAPTAPVTGQISVDAAKKGRVCIACKWNELTAKNETTCGR